MVFSAISRHKSKKREKFLSKALARKPCGGLIRNGLQHLWRDFVWANHLQRQQHKSAFLPTRMRQHQIGALHLRIPIKKHIQVEGARRMVVVAGTARSILDMLQSLQQLNCIQAGLDVRHRVHIHGAISVYGGAAEQGGGLLQLRVWQSGDGQQSLPHSQSRVT